MNGKVRAVPAAMLMGVLLAVLWGLEVFDQATGTWLDSYGIHAREVDGLPEIFTAPFLHAGFDHLASNSLPFFVLGFLVLLGGFARWFVSSLIAVIVSGVTAWFLTPADTIILGASGLILGWLTFVIVSGFFSRSVRQVVVALIVLFFYGGMIWGVFPTVAGVSWQAHLGGAVGGVLAAVLLRNRSRRGSPYVSQSAYR